MLSQLTRWAKNVLSRLLSAADHLFRCLTEPARANPVTVTLDDLPRHRAEVLAENALLRQHLIVLRRRTETAQLPWRERFSLLLLVRWARNWKQVRQVIQPETLLRCHREGFRRFSPVLAAEVARAYAGAARAPSTLRFELKATIC